MQLHELIQDKLLCERDVVKVALSGLFGPCEIDVDRAVDLRKIEQIPADVFLGLFLELCSHVRPRPAGLDVLVKAGKFERHHGLVDHLSAFLTPSITARPASPIRAPALKVAIVTTAFRTRFILSRSKHEIRIFVMFVHLLLGEDLNRFRIHVRILC